MTLTKSPKNEQDLINIFSEAFASDTIDSEKLESVFTDIKERKERKRILSNYKIGYIKKQDLYYIRLKGKLYRKRHKEDLEDLIIEHEKSELHGHIPTLRKIYPTVLSLTKREKEVRIWTKYEQYWARFFETYAELIDKPLDQITRMDGYLFFDHVKKTLGGKIKKQYWLNIKSFANFLFESDEAMNIINKNPWATLKPGKWEFEPPTHYQKGSDVFNDTELFIIRSEIWMEMAETGDTLPLSIILLAGTGMRIGEISALTWVDIEDNSIRIHKKIVPKLVNIFAFFSYRQSAIRAVLHLFDVHCRDTDPRIIFREKTCQRFFCFV